MANKMSAKEPIIHIVGISGSLRAGSYTRRAVECALLGAAEAGAETRLIDLRDYHLVFRVSTDEAGYPDDVLRLRTEVKQAEGVILGTPEYHGSFSGVLKNALDLMGFDEVEGKIDRPGWRIRRPHGRIRRAEQPAQYRTSAARLGNSRADIGPGGLEGVLRGRKDRRRSIRRASERNRPPGGSLRATPQMRKRAGVPQQLAKSSG